ncbi:MAG: DUF6502 family protein [Hyphomicrobiales bacterium]
MSHLYDRGAEILFTAAFRNALRRVLRPIVRTLIARGLRYPELGEMLKELYVDASDRHFRIGGKRLTDSRISLLTGLQRKDVRAVRSRLGDHAEEAEATGAGPLPRVIAQWLGGAPYSDASGAPRPLHRISGDGSPSFEALVAEVSRDIHPRTVLDELKRQDLVDHDATSDLVVLRAAAFLPAQDEEALVGYFGANLGDHAEAAAANLDAAPEPGPFFERAVHYNKLTPATVAKLETRARDLQSDVLSKLNAEALDLQKRDAGDKSATGRFRCGAFVYRSDRERQETDE